MWKNSDYEIAAPAVKAHFHALRAEAAWKRDDFLQAEHESRSASEHFLEAVNHIQDKRTIDALFLLAENYEYRANEARARLPDTTSVAKPDPDSPSNPTQAIPPTDTKIRKDDTSVAPKTLSSVGEEHDTQLSATAELQLNQASAEMEELWRRLNELGLSSTGNTDKTHLLISSRHLSSSLGDSFCLLPTKNRASVGIHASAVDGASTLRAAVASRMRNQRVRLMEKQYGPRAAVAHPPQSSSFQEGEPVVDSMHTRVNERRGSGSNRSSVNEPHEVDGMNDTVAHQKQEIVRLLNTVKTLSSENTTLLKKCDALAQVQEENRELQQSMENFKKHYNQKLVMIKRALEEWRRQQRSQSGQNHDHIVSVPSSSIVNSELEEQTQRQQEELSKLKDAIRIKDEQLAKYDKWYQTLKAGARAKRSASSGGVTSRTNIARDSFTNSNSLHEIGDSQTHVDTGSITYSTHGYSMTAASAAIDPVRNNSGSRPPTHPNQRTL